MYVAFSHRYDRKEISNGELPGFFVESCITGPGVRSVSDHWSLVSLDRADITDEPYVKLCVTGTS